MRTFPVMLRKTEDVLNFVKIVSGFDGDVDLKSGSIVIDAKSLMGAIAMTGSRKLEMVVHSTECDKLVHELADYLCA
ncbi:MAG: HPr family phosphocarrier protein [Lachnospiraceae bacterium]|nr:HPr family phosphocarrier protein [Lachnospiraceae bacterium]